MDDFAEWMLGGSGGVGLPKGPGTGSAPAQPVMPPWRATSRHLCGLYPFIAGGGPPTIGVPMGRILDGQGFLCADHISWFRAGLISAPSAMVLALNGLGKSSMTRRMIIGHAHMGINSVVLGDIKPDYLELMHALGGQVIQIGHGRGGINPLDAGNVDEAAALLSDHPDIRTELLQAAHERKKSMIFMLMHIQRKRFPNDREQSVIDEAISILERRGGKASLVDLLNLVREAPAELREVALDRGDESRYREVTEELEVTLQALLRGEMGAIFTARETTPMLTDRSVIFDVSAIPGHQRDLRAAVLLACWSYGFATVEIAQSLADAGVTPRRFFDLIMEEVWSIIQVSSDMVDNINALTRLNRTYGVGQVMITHSMADFNALAKEEDRNKARGFVSRSKMLYLGGLPREEMELLGGVMPFSESEKERLIGWAASGGYDPFARSALDPPGMGKFMLKIGGAPGYTFRLDLCAEELALSEKSNSRWDRSVAS